MSTHFGHIKTNIDKCSRILLNHHFIKTIRSSNMFYLLEVHLQGVQLIHSSRASQQNDSPVLKFWQSKSFVILYLL